MQQNGRDSSLGIREEMFHNGTASGQTTAPWPDLASYLPL